MSEGCMECDTYGTTCNKCTTGYALEPVPSEDPDSPSYKDKCSLCNNQLPNCIQCSKTTECEVCANGYVVNESTK